ncbi:MAG: zinc metalloprotease [Woeseia sp.]|jgi:regulator of sigma E protease|nr:MAG: zinc metalloprotease [Woeseia sp.]
MDFLFSIIAFIVLVGILVAIHEYGHFIAAKLCNVKVLRYSIGFGKVLMSRRGGEDQTEYCLSAIPLGGYVQLLDERSEDVPQEERHRAFNTQSATKRIFILFAGPFANFLFAIVAYILMFTSGIPGQVPIIGEVDKSSIAWENNIRSGDRILSIGNREVDTWQGSLISMIGEVLNDERIEMSLIDQSNQQKEIILDVRGRTKELTAPNALFPGIGFKPFQPKISPVVVSVVEGSPASFSGVQPDDILIKINNVEIENLDQFAELIVSKPGERIDLELERNNQTYITQVDLGIKEDDSTKGFIGLQTTIDQEKISQYLAVQKYSFPENITMAFDQTNQMIVLTLNMFGKMVTGQISGKNLSGPVGIAKDAGTVAKRGLIATLSFMAIISISLGILNLLPIPVLDGGQILFVLIEKLIRRPLPDNIQLAFQQIGVGALLFLMVFALYNDLVRIFN